MKAFLCLLALLPAVGSAQNYIIQTVAGTTNAGDGGRASSALLLQAEGIAIDSQGNVYLADAGDNRVRKITLDGIIHTVAGTGIAGFAGDGGPAIAAQLSHPYGIALDNAGNLYIADLGNSRVRKVTVAGIISTIAGGGTTPILAATSIPATGATLSSPRNLALDIQGNLYISDFGAQQVYQANSSGAMSLFAGTGNAGYTGDGGGATLAELAYPAGLATDSSGNVFIADSGNNCLRRVWRGGITTVAANVPSPTGVALDGTGHVYVASSSIAARSSAASTGGFAVDLIPGEDVAANTVGSVLYVATQHAALKLTGAAQTTIAGTPNFSTYGDGGPATLARLGGPVALAIDTSGNVYIAEQSAGRIRKTSSDSSISIVADSVQMKSPSGVAVDTAGTIYFSDTGNNRVRRISAGGVLSNVLDKLNAPTCIRTSADGSLYVCDTGNNRILKVTSAGVMSVIAAVPGPSGLAITSDGSVFVSTGSQVVQISAAGAITILDGLSAPAGLAMVSGELLIAESGRNRVLKLGAAGAVTVIAGTGQAGASGAGGLASSAQLNNPTDVAVDASGNIFIADAGNNFIRELTAATLIGEVTLAPLTVVSAASMFPGAVAPNEIVAIFGTGFDPDHTQVFFDNAAATVFYAGGSQLNVLVPSTVQPNATTNLNVYANGVLAGLSTLSTVAAIPGLFTMSGGMGPAAALNDDLTLNTSDNPEPRGGIIVLYLTGDGGRPGSVQIGGYAADVLYDGPVPGCPGLTQINARVPAGFLADGVQPVVVTVNGISTQPGVTIVLR